MKKQTFIIGSAFIFIFNVAFSQVDKSDWEEGTPDGCTSITAGKLATADGSVITSHTDDSHRTRSWIDIVPAMDTKREKQLPCINEQLVIHWPCRHTTTN